LQIETNSRAETRSTDSNTHKTEDRSQQTTDNKEQRGKGKKSVRKPKWRVEGVKKKILLQMETVDYRRPRVGGGGTGGGEISYCKSEQDGGPSDVQCRENKKSRP
jgi:hypothetical protein